MDRVVGWCLHYHELQVFSCCCCHCLVSLCLHAALIFPAIENICTLSYWYKVTILLSCIVCTFTVQFPGASCPRDGPKQHQPHPANDGAGEVLSKLSLSC